MQNLTVHPGGPSPFLLGLAHARPRTRTPAPPGTVLVHPSDASLPFVSAGNACAAHVAHERCARAAARRCPPVGARPHGTPMLRGTPRPNPTLSPPSAALPLSHFLPAHCPARSPVSTPLRLPLSSTQLSPPLPTPGPLPPATGCLSFTRIPTEHRRHPPLPGELLPELPIPTISSPRLPLRCCRTPHPPSPPTGAPSPPMNAAARRRLRCLTVDPPFRCAPAL
jgi:hypothetical protein